MKLDERLKRLEAQQTVQLCGSDPEYIRAAEWLSRRPDLFSMTQPEIMAIDCPDGIDPKPFNDAKHHICELLETI